MKAEPFKDGVVTFSLDTELAWSQIHRRRYDEISDILDKGVYAIEQLLAAFDKYNMPATWAVVGQLLRSDVDQPPDTAGIQLFEATEDIPWGRDWWHTPETIQKIRDSSVDHEIGSHSGNHILFDQHGPEVIQSDLAAYDEWHTEIISDPVRSFVFPDNRVGHFDLLTEFGYSCYRGPTPIPVLDQAPKSFLPRKRDGIINIPMSISYRPYNGRNIFYRNIPQSMKNKAVKLGTEHAIRRGKVFHIALHPKDFAVTDGFLEGFINCLEYISERRNNGIEVLTMKDIAERAKF